MLKRVIGVVTALFIVGAPMAHAQSAAGAGEAPDNGRLSQTEFKILTDARVGMVKVALQLTPEQQQSWPAVEEAIRARSEARYRRLSAFAERAAGLKKLADAWQPLYQSLTPDQKTRLRLVTVRALEGVRAAAESRRMDMSDEEDSDF